MSRRLASVPALRPPVAAPRVTQKRTELPFHTPEAMLEVVMAGKPNFDLVAMADSGKAYRESLHNTASAAAINLPKLSGTLHVEQLIGALGQVKLDALQASGKRPTAAFDFDGTLARGEIFFDFSKLLAKADAFPATNAQRCARLVERATEGAVTAASLAHLTTGEVVAHANALAHRGELSLGAAFYVYVAAMTGMKMTTLTALANKLFSEGVDGVPYKDKAFDGSHELVAKMKSLGIEPHIVTMGLAFIPRAGARHWGIEPKNVHGFELEVVDGLVTGRAVDVRSLGKHRLCDAKVPCRPLMCFGDSFDSDTPLLQRASALAVVVDPNKAMCAFMDQHKPDYVRLTYSAIRTALGK